MRVDIWSDVVCPWCYVGKRRFETALAAFDGAADVEVVHHSFQLNPAAPHGQTSDRREMLMQKYRLSRPQVDEMDRRMTETAAAEGLQYRLDGTRSGNTFDAHQLLQFAKTRGVQDALLERLYRAYFTEQRSIFERDSLVALAADVGLDAAEARAVLEENRFAAAVEEDIDTARRLGANGVPFFVIDGRLGISGAQPPAVFVEALQRAASG
jgi:predicted DsbA family dithiol-disulfide isomerase